MWSRLLLVVLMGLGTASCGFTPVHAPGSETSQALSEIIVAPPGNNRASYIFVIKLEDRIGRNPDGNKVLQHDIWVYEQGFGSFGRPFNRTQMIGKVTYKVVSLEDDRVLFGGTVENFVTFFTNDDITTSVRKNAIEDLMTILADQLNTDLTGRLSRRDS